MWRAVFISVLTSALVFGLKDNIINNGIFKLHNIDKCEDPEQYSLHFEVKKRKIDRSNDGLNITLELPDVFTADYGLRLETYVKCDGGYKASDIVSFASACQALKEFAKENFETLLVKAGVDPPDCPVPKGTLEIDDFIVNYDNLPQQAKTGDYKTQAFLVKNGEDMACVIVYTSFWPREDED